MKITGKHRRVSREFIRAWVNASACILAHHNYPIDLSTLKVQIKDLRKRVNKVTGGGVGGTANWSTNTIELSNRGKRDWLSQAILHECIHIGCGNFGEGTNEKVTSTLTSRLYPAVHGLAEYLQETDNQLRAFFAHTKLSYRNAEGVDDYYDDAQVEVASESLVKDKHKRRRSTKRLREVLKGIEVTV